MKPLGSLESAQEAWSNSYAPFVLSKHPACFISRWTHADIWTIAKSQLTWIRIPSLTWRTVKSSLLAPYSGLVHRRASRGIKRRLIQVPNGIIFPSFLWEMHPHILLHKLRVTHATLRCKWHETFWLLLQPQAAQAHVSRKSQRWIHERVTRCVTRC